MFQPNPSFERQHKGTCAHVQRLLFTCLIQCVSRGNARNLDCGVDRHTRSGSLCKRVPFFTMSSVPSLTQTWHSDTYPSIDPRARPELSLKDKRVVITGGGAGIGRAFVEAFADAGAANIFILGRRGNVLEEVQHCIETDHPSVSVHVLPADFTDLESVKKAAYEVGTWDVLVSNAGYMATVQPVTQSDPEDWWKAFEVSVVFLYRDRPVV